MYVLTINYVCLLLNHDFYFILIAGDSKSVISQVYEVALKMKLPIKFEVLKEDGLPHMKTYITKCTVGTYNATGEGNGKKVNLPNFRQIETNV